VHDRGGEGEEGEDGEPKKKRKKKQAPKPGELPPLTEEEEKVQRALRQSGSKSVEGEDWSVHDRWQVPVFVKGAPTMFLEVTTTTVMPTVVGKFKGRLMQSLVGKDGSETVPLIDFGKLPVGQEAVLTISLTNVSKVGTVVSPHILDPFGPFVLLKSPSFMEAGASQAVSLAFRPRKESTFRENNWLEFAGGRLRYCLTGIGVSPHFAVEGLEVDNGMVDIGDVLAGRELARSFTLRNQSPFEVTYNIQIRNVGEVNASNLNPVDCVPARKAVAAGEEQEVALTFAGDTESLQYQAMVKVVVPNQKEKLEYRVVGRCWAQAAFLYDPSPTARSAPLRLDRFKDQAGGGEEAAPIKLEHTFPMTAAQAREEAEFPLRVGNCGGGGVEVAWDNLADVQALGFTLDPAPGKVDAGSVTDFSIKYMPGEGMPLSMWNDIVLSGTLKGGDPAPAGGGVPVQIKLRGFLPPSE